MKRSELKSLIRESVREVILERGNLTNPETWKRFCELIQKYRKIKIGGKMYGATISGTNLFLNIDKLGQFSASEISDYTIEGDHLVVTL